MQADKEADAYACLTSPSGATMICLNSGANVLGRGAAGVLDVRISKRHAIVTCKDGQATCESTGVNPVQVRACTARMHCSLCEPQAVRGDANQYLSVA